MSETDERAQRIAAARARAEAARQARAAPPSDNGPPAVARPETMPAGAEQPTTAALSPWRGASGPGVSVVVATPASGVAQTRTAAERDLHTRRSLLRTSFWAGLVVTGAGLLLGFVNLVWPRNVVRAGEVFRVLKQQVPAPGAEPVHFAGGRFYLVNLKAGEGAPPPPSAPSVAAPSERGGASSPCGRSARTWDARCRGGRSSTLTGSEDGFAATLGSTYTTAGVRVWGPAPRSMDTFAVTVNGDGSVDVDTSAITPGTTENPQRAALR